MALLRIEERRTVEAPAELVWQHSFDPERTVVCLRCATLESVTAVRKCAGRVTVKVGALSVQYRGTIEYTAIDHGARHVSMVGKG